MAASRRELIKGFAMSAAALPTVARTVVSAQGTGPIPGDADTEAFLKQFEEAWRSLDPLCVPETSSGDDFGFDRENSLFLN
jgi:hypothetical protein